MTHSSSLAMQRYSIAPRTKNMLKDMGFYYLLENIKKIVGYKTGFFKNYFQKSSP